MFTSSPFAAVSIVISWFDGVFPLIVASRRSQQYLLNSTMSRICASNFYTLKPVSQIIKSLVLLFFSCNDGEFMISQGTIFHCWISQLLLGGFHFVVKFCQNWFLCKFLRVTYNLFYIDSPNISVFQNKSNKSL